ncbi:MAG: C1 family peptidase [bacterium]
MNYGKFGLGRIHVEDKRDENFLMKSMIPLEKEKKFYKYWHPSIWWGNQRASPHCVGYSWVHWLTEGPITQKKSRKSTDIPYDPSKLYYEAQKVDQWEGENYDGTSVRAGAKILKQRGFISEYRWAWTIEDVIDGLLYAGPLVVGTFWTEGMFFPDDDGIITATGQTAGGHAYLLDGINTKRGIIRIKNSWGREWGNKGFAYISIDDMAKLISYQGEACLAVEIDKK